MTSDKTITYKSKFSLFLQLTVVILPFVLFYDVALGFRGLINLSPLVGIFVAILINGTLFALVSLSLFFYQRKKKDGAHLFPKQNRFTSCLIKVWPVLLVTLIFSVLAILQFDNVPRYDGSQYYSALITATESFQYDFISIASSFVLMSHPTQGFALFLSIGEMLFPKQSVGIYAVTLLLVLLSILCLYDILGKIVPESTPVVRTAGVAIFAFCPYILGLFSYTTPDYFMTVFFIMMVWAFQKELDILASFLALIVCFCKEPGILLVASFLTIALADRIVSVSPRGFWKNSLAYLWPSRLFLYGSIPIIYIIYFKTIGSMNFMSDYTNLSPLRWDNNGWHCFGFNPYYFFARLAQLLVYNFYWIGLLSGILLIVFLAVKSRFRIVATTNPDISTCSNAAEKTTKHADSPVMAGVFFSSFVFLIFTCFFMTNMCPRYVTFFSIPITIVCVIAISKMVRKSILASLILIIIAMLNIGQTYTNLDPTIAATCLKIDVGYQSIYSPVTSWFKKSPGLQNINDFYVYNRLFSYSDELIDAALREMNVNENDSILYVDSDWFELYVFGDVVVADHLIYWDPVSQKRTYDNSINGAFFPRYISFMEQEIAGEMDLLLPDTFYVMLPAARDKKNYLKDVLRRGYSIVDSFKKENNVGFICVYKLQKISD